ncbi:ABC transporter ATP-binding protein [Armatimonas sp.]|uniref:ABC transporter ATP-binding protein n=1 Tax=Armatimonas sp. TaxID=1872638 RepID=UPI00374C8B73
MSLLELSGIVKSFVGVEKPVLRGVNLSLGAGEMAAIVGPSGSGKSTLLNIIGTLDTPDRGSITLDGTSLVGLDEKALARVRSQKLGMIFQLHHLLPQCTVLENVLIPTLAEGPLQRQETPETRAKRLLERVGLADRLKHRPGQLSGGERQRVAVVRALLNEPKLLLADEPTGALDQDSANNLTDLLIELNKEEGVALLVITHSPELAAKLGKIYRLDEGLLV